MALELPDWNEALKLGLQWDQPVPTQQAAAAKAQLGGRTQGVGRVKAGVQGTVGAAQRKWQADDAAAGLRAEGLDALPNALEAEYWLRKAAAEEQAGRLEVRCSALQGTAALDVLKEALERDVRPVTDVLRAMQDLSKRLQMEEAPLDVTGTLLGDVGNRPLAGRFTPSKTGLTGKALRVPSRFARTPGGGTAAAERGAEGVAAPKTLTSVLKKLTFSAAKPALRPGLESAATHDSATPGPAAARQPGRHVSFGAGTVSPAARPAARRQSTVQFNTPQPTIDENEAAGSPAPSQVNSVNAGRTPYDSRLSGLFRKYNLLDTPAVPSDEEDGLDDELVGKSPSWRALSASVSVSDSIKGLAKKYSSDVESMLGLSSPELSPLAATPQPASAARSQGGNGTSPAMAPTPHHLLEGWQPNGLYESPSQAAGAPANAAAAPAIPTLQQDPVLTAATEQTGQQEANGAGQAAGSSGDPLLHGEISPYSGAVRLSAVDPAFCAHTDAERSPAATQAATPMSTADIDLSPLSLADDEELTGGTPVDRGMPVDGVPRDAAGIPLITPATVTVARGNSAASFREEDYDLAANLFESFDSPQISGGKGGFSFAPIASQPSGELEEAEEGDTPNLQPKAAAADTDTPGFGGPDPSPEILAYHEQLQLAEAGAQEPTFIMPRSILKSSAPVAADGTPLLGRAQRVGSPSKAPRGTATKELRSLLSDLSLEDGEVQSMGTLPMLSPVRAHGHLRAQLGVDKVVTPVRRSVRNQVSHAAVHDMLEQTNFSYVPNEALLAEDAAPKLEKKGAAKEEDAAEEVAQKEAAPKAEAGRRQSTRKSRLGADSSSGAAGSDVAAREGQQAPPSARRQSLRLSSMRTPTGGGITVYRTEAEDAEVFTPVASALGPQAPVPQDGSPALQESPGFAAPHIPVGPAAGPGRSARKVSRNSTPATTPVPSVAASEAEQPTTQRITRRRASMAAAAATATPQPIALSPTEQGIRSALRRSARKSMPHAG